MLAALIALNLAHADVAPTEPPGRQFVTHALRVEGMDVHPGHVLVVYNAPQDGVIRANLAYHSEGQAQQTLGDGSRARGNHFSKVRFHLMSRDRYSAWSSTTAQEIARQRTACAEKGEGCAHISRFVPRYPPPAQVVDCQVEIDVITQNEKKGPDQIVDVVRLKEAGDSVCVLEQGPRQEFRRSRLINEGCSTVHGLAAGTWLLTAILVAVSRRRRQ
ncbi:MAG: hypothetical protein AAFV53_06565 [Myxococcota bacterium]